MATSNNISEESFIVTNATLLPTIVASRGGAAILSFVINSIALIAYTIVCYILIRYRKQFNNSFYTLAIALAFPDATTGMLELFYAIPARLIDEQRMPYWYTYFVGFMSVSSWFMMTSILCVISVNRLIAVAYHTSYQKMFNKQRLTIIITLCYAYGIAMSTMMYVCRCKSIFPEFAWLFDCKFEGNCAEQSLKANQILSNASVAFIAICHIFMFIQVHRRKSMVSDFKSQSHDRKELLLMFQVSIIAGALIAYVSSFWVLPPLMANGLLSPTSGAIIINTFCNLNSCINPFLYLLFSSEIREKFKSLHS